MKRIKCSNCGFVTWATAESCKKCGAQLSESGNAGGPPQSANPQEVADPGPTNETRTGARRIGFGFAVVALFVLVAGLVAFKVSRSDRPQEFVFKDGSRKSSKTWFHSWFSSDPSVDDILDQYLKVSGWQANPTALRSFIAKGHFQIKNEAGETLLTTPDVYRIPVHEHWGSSDGEVEFEGEAPGKLVITQKCEEARVFQRGTNGTTGWWLKGWTDQYGEVDPHIRLVSTVQMGEMRGDWLTDFNRGADFVNYLQLSSRPPNLILSGKKIIGDRVAYELISRSSSGPATMMYFDVETGMPLSFASYRPVGPFIPLFERYQRPYSDLSGASETYLEDYREVSGVKLPFLIRQHIREYWITTAITDLKVNVTIEPTVFEKPASKTQTATAD